MASVEDRFDVLARALGQSPNRRAFVKALGAGLAGALFGGSGSARALATPAAPVTSSRPTSCAPGTPWHQCAQLCPDWCHANFPGDAGRFCAANGLDGLGPCWTCGPAAPPSHPDLCQGVCCPASTPACCGSSCTNLQTDVDNCGVCGNVCSGGRTCQNGRCVSASCITSADCAPGAGCPADAITGFCSRIQGPGFCVCGFPT